MAILQAAVIFMPSNESQPVKTHVVRSYCGYSYKSPDRISDFPTDDRKVSNPILVSPQPKASMRSIESSVNLFDEFFAITTGFCCLLLPLLRKERSKASPGLHTCPWLDLPHVPLRRTTGTRDGPATPCLVHRHLQLEILFSDLQKLSRSIAFLELALYTATTTSPTTRTRPRWQIPHR